MSTKPLSPIKTLWYKWKSQKWVPGRKRFLVGLDLHGNTFWEFRDTLNSHQHRMRRIVNYSGSAHHSDVKVSPQWLQWLRHTRKEAPSIAEQSQDMVRQEQLKILAARADQRWNEKASVLDAPGHVRGQPVPALGTQMAHSEEGTGMSPGRTSVVDDTTEPESVGDKIPESAMRTDTVRESKKKEETEDPWKKAQGGPSEQWQPKAWSGGKAAARR